MSARPDHNKLLDSLPESDRLELFAAGRDADLHSGQTLYQRGRTVPRVYFPTSGCLSVQAPSPSTGLEVMMVGFEGAIGCQLALGALALASR